MENADGIASPRQREMGTANKKSPTKAALSFGLLPLCLRDNVLATVAKNHAVRTIGPLPSQ